MFHDFGHSGGFFQDDLDNVLIAGRGLLRCASAICSSNGRLLSGEDIGLGPSAHSLIYDTKFPYQSLESIEQQYPDEALFMSHCLHDADMMQNCNDTLFANFVGVKQELFGYMPYEIYTEKSLEFLRNIKYETKYGQEVGQKLLDESIGHLEKFQKLVFPDSGHRD